MHERSPRSKLREVTTHQAQDRPGSTRSAIRRRTRACERRVAGFRWRCGGPHSPQQRSGCEKWLSGGEHGSGPRRSSVDGLTAADRPRSVARRESPLLWPAYHGTRSTELSGQWTLTLECTHSRGVERASDVQARDLNAPQTSILRVWNRWLQVSGHTCAPQRVLNAPRSASGPKQVDAPGSAAAQVRPRRTQDGAEVLDPVGHELKRDRLRRRG